MIAALERGDAGRLTRCEQIKNIKRWTTAIASLSTLTL